MATVWTRTGPQRSSRAVQATTETAPTDTSVGVALDGISAIMAVLSAPPGETFTGAGALLGYVYVPYGPNGPAWVRAPRSDQDLADAAGLPAFALPAAEVVSPAGLFIWIPSGVGLSGGATVTTDYICTLYRGSPPI